MAIHRQFQTCTPSLLGRCPSYHHLDQEQEDPASQEHDDDDPPGDVLYTNYDGTITIDLDALEQDEGGEDDEGDYDAAMEQVASMLDVAVALCDDIGGPLDDDGEDPLLNLDQHFHQAPAVVQTTTQHDRGVPVQGSGLSDFISNGQNQVGYTFFMSGMQQ